MLPRGTTGTSHFCFRPVEDRKRKHAGYASGGALSRFRQADEFKPRPP